MARQYVPQGGEFRVNTYTTDYQYYQSIATLADGGFVVTWVSSGQDGSAGGVYGQVYSGDGIPVGSEFSVNTYTTGSQGGPSITGLLDGGFVVTWGSYGQDGSDNGVYGQLHSSDGSRVGNEFQINSYTRMNQDSPSVTSLSDGRFVVAWNSFGDYKWPSTGVFGRIYGEDGSLVGNEFKINTHIAGNQFSPAITGLADGKFVVTWTSDSQDGSSSGVFGQVYGSSGNPFGDEFRVNTYTLNSQCFQSITSLADGGFVVTWTSFGQDGSESGVYAQVYKSDGSRVGGEFSVNTYTTNWQSFPSIAGLVDGGFVVTWDSFGQDGSGDGVYGQVYSSDGSRVGNEFRVNNFIDGDQRWQTVTSLEDGGFVIAWTSNGQDGSDYGVYG